MNYLAGLTKIRDEHAERFAEAFHVPLARYWDPLTGFDLPKFDVEVVKSASHEAMIDVVQARYGEGAVKLIEALLDAEEALSRET